jgi:signal transduction histidine kinase
MHATKPAASEGEGTDVRPAAARAPVAAAGGPRPAVLDIPQPAAGGGRLGRLVALLPGGERLDDVSYAQRHRLGQLCLAFMAALLTVVAIVNERDLDVGHLAVDLSPMFVSWFIAWRAPNRTVSTLSVSFGLMAASSILVHLTEGLIEAHFLFFVLLPLIALYQDWRAFLGAIGFVVFHHAVVGTLAPEAVYNHPAAQAKPVLWGVIHTLFVVGLVLVLLAEWNLAEAEQRKTYRALSELTETQTELLAAQKMESIGQLAAGIAHEINTPMQYIGDNTSFLKASIGELLRFVDAAAACVDEAEQQGELTASQQSLAELLVSRRLTMLRERAPTAADDALSGVESVTGIVRAMKRFSHPGGDTPEPVDVNESILTTTIVCRNEWRS